MSARSAEATARVSRNTLDFLPEPDGVILDVGCGDGSLLNLLKGERIGVAPSLEEVGKLRTLWPGVHFEVGLAQSLPITDESISLLVCNGVLLLLDSEREVIKALHEFRRVCRPGATVFIGEMPVEADGRFPRDTVRTWLWALLRENGAKSFLAGVRDVLTAAMTSMPILFYPSTSFIASREHFLALCSTAGLQVLRERITPHLSTRRDYLLTAR